MTGPTVLDLRTISDDPGIRDFHRGMIVPNFPADEILPEDDLVEDVRGGDTQILAAVAQDGTFLAGAVGDWFPGSRVQLLSYLVVRPEARGLGVGSRLLTAAMDLWTEGSQPLLILGEVEDPRRFHDVGFGDPAARVRFYERLGVRSLLMPYAQPALSRDTSRVPGLLLMVFAASAAARLAGGNIDGGVVERFLTEYFTANEGAPRPGDALLEAMRAACRAAGGIPLRRVQELPEPSAY